MGIVELILFAIVGLLLLGVIGLSFYALGFRGLHIEKQAKEIMGFLDRGSGTTSAWDRSRLNP